MLQQTRVETVIPYFEAWLRRFPTIGKLAEAEEQEVLRLWQGLGYYSRARNLHRAAREVMRRYDGEIPGDPTTLETLPGIGPYTSGAVASIAFQVPVPAVDGNARRVLSRLTDDPDPGWPTLRRWASALIDPEAPGDFNQALMELGSKICSPRRPKCGECPLSDFCAARRAGTQSERPAPRRRRSVPRLVEAVAVLLCEARPSRSGSDDVDSTTPTRRVLLRRRPSTGLLGGMWEFPGGPVAAGEDPLEVARRVGRSLVSQSDGSRLERHSDCAAVDLGPVQRLRVVDHAFTHRRLQYVPFLFRLSAQGPAPEGDSELMWMDPYEAAGVPIPVAQLKVLTQVFGPTGPP